MKITLKMLAMTLRSRGYMVELEHKFAAPLRKWRFDAAIWRGQEKVALEVDGGVWTQGRHTRGAGWLKDAEKINTAAVLGWRVLHVTPDTIGDALALIEKCLDSKRQSA